MARIELGFLGYPIFRRPYSHRNNSIQFNSIGLEFINILDRRHQIIIIIIISLIIGETGTISESLRQYLSNIPGKHEIKELQKTAILVTAHILGKVLM